MRSFEIPRTNDPKIDASLTRIQQLLQDAFKRPLADVENLVKDVTLSTGDVRVAHGLNQVPTGWIIVKANSGANIYTVTPSDEPQKYINLRATAAITASLIFF